MASVHNGTLASAGLAPITTNTSGNYSYTSSTGDPTEFEAWSALYTAVARTLEERTWFMHGVQVHAVEDMARQWKGFKIVVKTKTSVVVLEGEEATFPEPGLIVQMQLLMGT